MPWLAPSQAKLSHQAGWVVGCRMVGIVCTLVSNILIARLLGPEGFGAFVLATTVLAFGCLLGLSGLSEAGLRFISENLGLRRERAARAYLSTTLYWASFSSITATGLAIVLLAFYQQLTGHSEITLIGISSLGLGVMVLAWQQLAAQLLRGLDDVRSASFFSGGQTGGPLSNLLFLMPLALAAIGLIPLSVTLVICLLVGSICLTLPVALWVLSRASRLVISQSTAIEPSQLSRSEQRDLASVAGSLLGIQLLAFVTTQTDIWIGGCMLGAQDFGFYGAAKRGQLIAHMPLQMALMTVQGTIPRLFAQRRILDLERTLRSAMTWAAIPAITALLLFAIFPVGVLTTIFGDSYAGGASIVVPLAVGLLALILFGSPADVLAITGNHQLVLWVNAVCAVALISSGILGAYWYGPVGLAIGSSLVGVLQNATLWWLAKKRLHIWTHLGFASWPT